MSHEQDTRARSGVIGLAAMVTLAGLASGCGPTPSTTTVPDSSADGTNPDEPDEPDEPDQPDQPDQPDIAGEQGTTTSPETDANSEAGGEQDIPADREGEWTNPGSVRG
jgi:hypothetical protein